MIGRTREGRYPVSPSLCNIGNPHIASPKPFTASHCRAIYYSVGEGFSRLMNYDKKEGLRTP
jgi:hypothetical protein